MNNTFENGTDNDVTIVSNQIFNGSLSSKAIGLYVCIAQVLATGGRISASVLADMNKDGISSVESGLRELEAAGWLRRSKKKDSKGHFYSVYELRNN
jgi:hypothetical protein